jgi:flagellar protein FlaG
MNDVKLTNLVPKPVRTEAPVREQASSLSPPGDSVVKLPPGETPASLKVINGTEPDQPEGDQEVTEEQSAALKEAVTKLNEYVQSVQRDLQFNMDSTSGKTVIKVLDRNTQEVIRQIPDEVVLKLARNLQYDEPVNLFNAKA